MNAEQEQMTVEQIKASEQPRWRVAAPWLLACFGGGALLIAAVLAWGYWQFGSLANTLAFLNGERLLSAILAF